MRAISRFLGQIYRVGAGLLGCCCCAEELEIVFSGLLDCPCRHMIGGADGYEAVTLNDLSGPYLLTPFTPADPFPSNVCDGEVCSYAALEVGSITLDRYENDGGCNVLVSTLTTTMDVYVCGSVTAGFRVLVYVHGYVDDGSVTQDFRSVFSGLGLGALPLVINNDQVDCSDGGGDPFDNTNYDGTATIDIP